MKAIRKAIGSGIFYPKLKSDLVVLVRKLLKKGPSVKRKCPVKAIISPHASFTFSGSVAGSIFAMVKNQKEIRRIVLLGPSHRVAFAGLAIPSADEFETPLGKVAVDRLSLIRMTEYADVSWLDEAHRYEHSLEVQLPFIQMLFPMASIIPIVVGDVDPESIVSVLDEVWGGRETLIVVTTDLSHDLPCNEANARDRRASETIKALDGDALNAEDVCGLLPLKGFLKMAKAKRLKLISMVLKNSGDRGCTSDRVVGYGGYAFAA